ncbi:MAG: mono/diheme cytochrome c family protein [Bacteroidia bacterium]|jgi:mono/diheme cytochrome c family protein
MIKLNKILVILITLTLWLVSSTGCYYDVEQELYPSSTPCDTFNITYGNHISGLLTGNCLQCHSKNDFAALGGNVNLDGHAQVKIYADNGKLLKAIQHGPGASPMPKGSAKLNACLIVQMQAWISAGSPNN